MNNAIRLLAAALLLLLLIAIACQRQAIAAGAPAGIAIARGNQPFAGASTTRYFSGSSAGNSTCVSPEGVWVP